MTCPRCGKYLMITSTTDWDSNMTYYYPLCCNCGYTTRHIFEDPQLVKNYIAIRFPGLEKNP